jgi:eukaryotic-like serine/threonine-protein kinase
VVRILDVDEADGAAFLVMEFLQGEDLDELSARGPLPVETAVDYALQACAGLAAVHALGMIHRDVKPANLFLAREPDGSDIVKLLDFGISKAETESGDLALTSQDSTVGSPLYMSPEQLKAPQDVDARTDVWSLGIVLYQLLSGSLPFQATSAQSLAARIASDPPAPLVDLRPGLPAALVEAVARCLEKDPCARFAGVVELAEALAPFAPRGAERAADVARAATASVRGPALEPSDPVAVERPVEVATERITATLSHEQERLEPQRGRLDSRDSGMLPATAALSVTNGKRLSQRPEPSTSTGSRLALAALALASAAILTWIVWPKASAAPPREESAPALSDERAEESTPLPAGSEQPRPPPSASIALPSRPRAASPRNAKLPAAKSSAAPPAPTPKRDPSELDLK